MQLRIDSRVIVVGFLLSTYGHVLWAACPGGSCYVDDNCSPPTDGTSGDPDCTIQEGINRAVNGDTVLVHPGRYAEFIDCSRKGVSVVSTNGAAVTTITLRENGGGRALVKFDCLSGTCGTNHGALDGFTVTGAGLGGGIEVFSASPTIRNNIIRANGNISSSGGGIDLSNSSALVEQNSISSNSATVGGGIIVSGGSPVIERNHICNNSASTGGGIYAENPVSLIVRDCTIVGNSATQTVGNAGGGMRLSGGGSVTVSRCVLAGNEAAWYGGGIASKDIEVIASTCLNPLTVNIDNTLFTNNRSLQQSGGGISIGNCTIGTATHTTFSRNDALTGPAIFAAFGNDTYTVTESILWGNAVPGDGKAEIAIDSGSLVVSYSDVEGGFAGVGNIGANPSDDPLFFDPATDNYHIKTGSPAINAAFGCDAGAVDLDGNPRCVNGVEDMGAYEWPECDEDADCNDGQFCNGNETCVTGVCQREVLDDCNCNGVDDDCDIEVATSNDCNDNATPDECEEGGPFPSQLKACSVKSDGSLWRKLNNHLRLTFTCDITTPVAGTDLHVNQLLTDGGFGTEELADDFALAVLQDGNGKPRILRLKAEPDATLQQETWYGVRGSWSGIVSFTLHYVNMIGDATNDLAVLQSDLGLINTGVPMNPAAEDDRRDINGDGKILFSDLGLANAYVPTTAPAKPSGHAASCGSCCP